MNLICVFANDDNNQATNNPTLESVYDNPACLPFSSNTKKRSERSLLKRTLYSSSSLFCVSKTDEMINLASHPQSIIDLSATKHQ
ncbi:hypothetical protein, partial [Bartonella sp. CM120XJJH]|uniref:hypothetical protein n=1 Tax=Bartonella sp. CM120XJJH TaxID=3243544 RepID=UPI0035CEFA71